MKKVLVACGTGSATSALVAQEIEKIFNDRGYGGRITFSTCAVAELEAMADSFDLVITTAHFGKKLPTKVILGVAFLTHVGMEPVIQEVIKSLDL
jgi:PTS system galactitol-specific IIB component